MLAFGEFAVVGTTEFSCGGLEWEGGENTESLVYETESVDSGKVPAGFSGIVHRPAIKELSPRTLKENGTRASAINPAGDRRTEIRWHDHRC